MADHSPGANDNTIRLWSAVSGKESIRLCEGILERELCDFSPMGLELRPALMTKRLAYGMYFQALR